MCPGFQEYKLKLYYIKGIVKPKIKIILNCTHPQATQEVDEFVS